MLSVYSVGRIIRRFDFAIELALQKPDNHAIAARDGRRIAEDCGLVRIPRDGVAACEDRERTERVEPCGTFSELRLHTMVPAACGVPESHP